MGVIWTRQPQIAVPIDQSNPITRGLLRVATPFDRFLLIPSGVTRKAYPNGIGLSSVNTAGAQVSDKRILAGLDQSTAFSAFSSNGLDPVQNGAMLYCERSESVQIWKFGLASNVTTAIGFVIRNSASVLILNETTVLLNATRQLHTAALVSNGASSRTIWADGNSAVNTTTLANTFTDANDVRIGGDSQDTTQSYFSGGIFYVATWNRALTSAEILSLDANPWQIFAPLDDITGWFTGFSAAPAGGFKPYWARNQTRILGAGMR